MTRVVLVRHGQTEWNREERFRGKVDIELDETGFRQVAAAAEQVAQYGPVAVYSSPLKRAMSTAEPIARRLGLRVEPLEGINDMDFGSWQGMAIAEVRERYPQLFEQWRYSPERLQIPGGESLDGVRDRVVAALDGAVARHEDQTFAFVTHRVVCKVLLCYLLGMDNSHFWQIAQDAAAINVFDVWEGGANVRLINDTCHLKENLGA
ncbi:MAG: histidine phosphatase family protein [Chloroflexota bacterium]|nr:histidine phosphatase family protein [Chloroflexota bacterium]